MPIVHRQLINELVALAQGLARYTNSPQSVHEDPAEAIDQLSEGNQLSSAIALEPLGLGYDPLGNDIQEPADVFRYKQNLNLRVVMLATTPLERDAVAEEYLPLLEGPFTTNLKVPLLITAASFGKEQGKRPVYAMSCLLTAEFHTMSDSPSVAI